MDPKAEESSPEELRDALDSLRREIRSRFPVRSELMAPTGRANWEDLYVRLRRAASTFGMSERSAEVDEFGMDDLSLAQARPILEFLYDTYWRVDLHGVQNLPDEGPILLVANRSGLLPYDGLMISQALRRAKPGIPQPRFLVADWLITLPFAQSYLARLGGVRACRENAERLLGSGINVIAFPEGAQGAAKVYRDRYRLKRFGRGGILRMALECEVPLVPVGVVGAEEAHPVLFKWGTAARAVGLPFVPVTPTFPLLGPLGCLPLPSKWVIRIGEPIALDHLEPDAAFDELLISRMTEELRGCIQGLVDAGLADRESIWS